MQNDLNSILRKHGLSLCEYYAMTCPEYHIYCDPKNASIETVFLVDSDEFTADDYLSAIFELINRNVLKLAEQDYQQTDSTIPKAKVYDLQKGDVIFTEEGFWLHRTVLKALYGDKRVFQRDSFVLENEEEQLLIYYAKTKELCAEWLFDMQQKTIEPNLDSYIEGTAQIERIDEPKQIVQWQPNEYLVHDTGYSCSIYYKKIELPSFGIEPLDLMADVLSLEPIFISGSFQGNDFSFSDVASWRPENGSDKLNDSCAIFQWYFHVDDEPSSTRVTPVQANLTGEPPTVKGYVIPHYKFELSEGKERSNMMSLDAAKAILEKCCYEYLQQKT